MCLLRLHLVPLITVCFSVQEGADSFEAHQEAVGLVGSSDAQRS